MSNVSVNEYFAALMGRACGPDMARDPPVDDHCSSLQSHPYSLSSPHNIMF